MWLVLSSGKQNLATWSMWYQFWKYERCKNREVVESHTNIPDSHQGQIPDYVPEGGARVEPDSLLDCVTKRDKGCSSGDGEKGPTWQQTQTESQMSPRKNKRKAK